jgi:putative glycosyltransferase (TIGR04372 family)
MPLLMRPRYRQFIFLCFVVTGAMLNLLPRRGLFLVLVLCEAAGFPGRRRLYQAYFPYVTSFLTRCPGFRFSSGLSLRFISSSVGVLQGIGAHQELSGLVDYFKDQFMSTTVRHSLIRSLFELGEFEKARRVAADATQSELASVPDLAHHKAMLDVIADDEVGAIDDFYWACRGSFHFLRPHQNIAARTSSSYYPNALDFICGASGRLYDLCNFAGQRVVHVGLGELGTRLYKRALDAQAQLRSMPAPPLSNELARLLQQLDVSFDELRIVPEEWTTQIGHLGMLDILFRMRDLGWWTGKAVIVVRRHLVANAAFFKLLEGFGKVVVVGETAPEHVAEELLSLQRWCGMNFNAFRLPDGTVVPWQDAGALALEQWEREGRGHPLRDVYDRTFGLVDFPSEFKRLRENWGLKPDDWYVCFHTRDAGHYLELSGAGQTHRNSPIEVSLDAMRFITSKGGWVIKLGGPNSPKLPKIDRAIDYALSDVRSDLMDIHLIRHARAFLGTTSGLTNVAISLGIPSAIVNGITTDAQLWNRNVRFALKPVRLADGTLLTQRQLTSAPWRWRVFDAAVLGRNGGYPANNSADEIFEAVREVILFADGNSAEFEREYDTKVLWSRWRERLSFPHFYGASKPSLYYLQKYEKDFLA